MGPHRGSSTLNRQPPLGDTVLDKRPIIFCYPHFIRVVVESKNRYAPIAHLKVSATPNAFLGEWARFRKIGYWLPVHEHYRIRGPLNRGEHDSAIVRGRD